MIINSPFLAARKSAGGLTFSKWKGLNTARARVFKNGSKTPKQIFQRDKFSFISLISQLMGKALIKSLWSQYEKNNTYMNQFFSYNLPLQPDFVNESTPFEGDALEVKITKGSIEPIGIIGDPTYNVATGAVEVVTDTTISGNGLDTDEIIAAVGNGIAGVSDIVLTETRVDGSVSLSLPAGLTPSECTVYIGVKRTLTDGTIQTGISNAKDCVAA